MRTITSSKASKEFGNFIDTVQREPVLITRQSRPVAITISIQEAEEWYKYKVDTGIQQGIADVKAGRVRELTPEYAKEMLAEFSKPHQKQ